MLNKGASVSDTSLVVMMICHYDETNSSGGLDKQARFLSRALRSQGENVIVLASTRKLSNARWMLDQNVPVRLFWTYASPQISGRYLPAALIWAIQLLIWIAINRKRISLLHCHQIRIHSFVAAIARKLFGIPAIHKMAVGGDGADIKAIGTRKYFGAPGRRFVVRHSDRFIALTPSMREDLLAYRVPNNKVVVIPNGVLMKDPKSLPLAREERARRCLFLARLAPDKNAPSLARAALEVAKEADLTVHFYGKGRDLPKLEAILSKHRHPRVVYKGWVSDPVEICGEYGFLLLASNAEGLSNSMIEAMSQGVVPIATRVSGCIDHITADETGYFFEGTDDESLIQGLRLAVDTSAPQWARMSALARRRSRELFDMNNVSQDYRRLYADLMSPPHEMRQP